MKLIGIVIGILITMLLLVNILQGDLMNQVGKVVDINERAGTVTLKRAITINANGVITVYPEGTILSVR